MISKLSGKHRVFARVIFLVLMAVFTCTGLARAEGSATQSDPKTWLIATQQAMSHLNYRGMVSYLKDNRLENLQVVHGVIGGKEYERLLSVNTPMREIVREPEKVTCYFPDSRSMSVDHKPARRSFLLELPNDLNELSGNYAIELGDTETIAQRQARKVSIRPLDDFRYARRLWVDVESKLPLKYQLSDESGVALEEMVFNTLSIESSIPERDFLPTTRPDASWQVKQHERLSAETLAWTLDDVPSGFRMIAYTRLKRGPDNRAVDHILLGDGFSSVSIYIDQFMKDIFTGQPRKVGAINSYTRKLEGYLITVMGEVPAKTVQTIANGIRQQDTAIHD